MKRAIAKLPKWWPWGMLVIAWIGMARSADAGVLEDIVVAWEKRAKSAENFELQWTERTFFPAKSVPSTTMKGGTNRLPLEDLTVESSVRFLFANERSSFRTQGPQVVNELATFVDREYLTVNNGEKCKSRFSGGEHEGISFHPSVSVTLAANDLNANSIRTLPARLWYRPFDPKFGAQLDLRKFTVLDKREVVNGMECVVLEKSTVTSALCPVEPTDKSANAPFVETKTTLRDVLWVANSPGHVPVRYREFHNNQLAVSVTFDAPSLTADLPFQGWHARMLNTSTTPPRTIEEITAVVSKLATNATIDPAEFDLKIPVGALVNDSTTQEYFIQRAGGVKRLILENECRWGITYKELAATESGKAVVPSESK